MPVDLLINNAGLGRFGLLAENTPEGELEMIEVNCIAPVQLTRALLPTMAARAAEGSRRAGIIVVASTAAFFPLPRLATYAATKAFDLVFAEGLAGELAGEPVDVLALCPGPTDTRFFERSGLTSVSPPAMASADRVAREGLRALGRRSLHVVGGANRAAILAARLTPRAWLRAGARGASSAVSSSSCSPSRGAARRSGSRPAGVRSAEPMCMSLPARGCSTSVKNSRARRCSDSAICFRPITGAAQIRCFCISW